MCSAPGRRSRAQQADGVKSSLRESSQAVLAASGIMISEVRWGGIKGINFCAESARGERGFISSRDPRAARRTYLTPTFASPPKGGVSSPGDARSLVVGGVAIGGGGLVGQVQRRLAPHPTLPTILDARG